MKMNILRLTILLAVCFNCSAQREYTPFPPPGSYPSDYMCAGYPMAFEDGNLTPEEKMFIWNDYKGVWERSFPVGLYGVSTNTTTLMQLPEGGDVLFYGNIYRENPSFGPEIYWNEFEQIGAIVGFGSVLPVTKVLSDRYRIIRELPNFEIAYTALDNFFNAMNNLESTNFTTMGDILVIEGQSDGDGPNMNIRYYLEDNRGAQYRPISVLHFAMDRYGLVDRLTSGMETRGGSLNASQRWEGVPIIYEQDRWKIYIPFEMQ